MRALNRAFDWSGHYRRRFRSRFGHLRAGALRVVCPSSYRKTDPWLRARQKSLFFGTRRLASRVVYRLSAENTTSGLRVETSGEACALSSGLICGCAVQDWGGACSATPADSELPGHVVYHGCFINIMLVNIVVITDKSLVCSSR
jgi:hypothetical protein